MKEPLNRVDKEAKDKAVKHDGDPSWTGQTDGMWGPLSGRSALLLLIGITWVPLLIGSLLQDVLVGDHITIPFAYDLEVHIRFLVALPLLLLASRAAELWLPALLKQFTARKLIPDDHCERFDAMLETAYRQRNSVYAIPVITLLVYVFGVLLFWRNIFLPEVDTWYSVARDGETALTPVGYWFALISLPVFQILLLRFYFHLFLWGRFLWQVSRLDLKLIPSHPDRMGGLGFLSEMTNVLAGFAMVHGALLAAWLSTRVVLLGQPLNGFLVEVGAVVLYVLVIVLTPMLAFTLPMRQCRRKGVREYGELVTSFESQFEERWIGKNSDGELGGGPTDFRDLANLGRVYTHVEAMRGTSITQRNIVLIAIATLLPVSPLLLTVLPIEEIVARAFSIIFGSVSAPSGH